MEVLKNIREIYFNPLDNILFLIMKQRCKAFHFCFECPFPFIKRSWPSETEEPAERFHVDTNAIFFIWIFCSSFIIVEKISFCLTILQINIIVYIFRYVGICAQKPARVRCWDTLHGLDLSFIFFICVLNTLKEPHTFFLKYFAFRRFVFYSQAI